MKLTAGLVIFVLFLGMPASAQEEKAKSSKREKIAFYGSIAALSVATALDIHSGHHLNPNQYYETRPAGNALGQILTTAISAGGAYIIHRFRKGRGQWAATALLAGGAAGHTVAAIHNYRLPSESKSGSAPR